MRIGGRCAVQSIKTNDKRGFRTRFRCISGRRAAIASQLRCNATIKGATNIYRSRLCPQLKTPAGVTLPPRQPQVPPPKNGFVDYAERMNSRAAMIGWIALLVLEGATGKGLFELIGLKVGGGLGFEL